MILHRLCANGRLTLRGSGTIDNPIVVRSFGDEQYAGCTGVPADSHVVKWLTVRGRIEQC